MSRNEAQFNMIEQQVRPWEVLDQDTLDLLGRLPRADFVPEGYHELAYADMEIPLGQGEHMMRPILEGRLLQALDLHATDKGLEIGTGSGYLSALMASCIQQLTSVEIHRSLSEKAGQRLHAQAITNVSLVVGDAAQGWGDGKELYDVIAVTGSLPVMPEALPKLLNRGGRLFAIVGQSPIMEAVLITRVADADWQQETLFETDLTALQNVQEAENFVF